VSTTTTLPASLRERLTGLARRIQALRALRSASVLVLTLAVLGGGLFLADSWLGLSLPALRVALAALVGVTAVLAGFGLAACLRRRPDAEALAALIEEKYPELAERLTSTVELAEGRDDYHGSANLIALLRQETEEQSRSLDFGAAYPARGTARLAAAAGLAVALVLLSAVCCEQTTDFGRRLLTSWFTPEAPVPLGYALQVAPGDVFAARGRPLAFAVRLKQTDTAVTLPAACTLVLTDAAGQVTRTAMAVEGPASFTYQIASIPGDLTYRVEVGKAVSDDYRVTAVVPVDLAADGVVATLTPPAYVNPQVHPVRRKVRLEDVAPPPIQHGRVRLDFHFTRPAQAARLHLTVKSDQAADKVRTLPLQLSAKRDEASIEVPAAEPGVWQMKVHLEAEHGIGTVKELAPLTVRRDLPPEFAEVPRKGGTVLGEDGKVGWSVAMDALGRPMHPQRAVTVGPQARLVQPDDTLQLRFAVKDDVGVGRLALEYQINEGATREEIILDAGGVLLARAEYLFKLAGRVKDGDVVFYRLRAADNRRVPEAGLAPQVIYHPARVADNDRWFVLKIDTKAESLRQQELQADLKDKQQEVLAQRDDVTGKLEAIQARLRSERDQLKKAQAEIQAQLKLTAEQAKSLRQLHKDNAAARSDLQKLARALAETPLQTVGQKAQEVAREELTRSDDALEKAQDKKAGTEERVPQLHRADQEVVAALKKLDDLKRLNDQQATARLDQLKLDNLAQRQEDLAQRTAELAAKDPVKGPSVAPQLAQLKEDQKKVAEALNQLTEQSDALKKALAAVLAEQAQARSEEALQLAQAQRELTEAAAKQAANDRLTELAKQQKALAEKTAQLATETAPAAQTAQAPPLKPEAAQRAAEALDKGDVGEAVQKQEQSAKDLERVAEKLDRAIALAGDPREAARQLARLQEGLEKRLAEEVKKKDGQSPLKERLKQLKPEQEAIQRAAQQLELPPANREAQNERKQAAERAAEAAAGLEAQPPERVKNQMRQAREALNRLADRLPNLEQRRQQALQQLADLRRQQNEVVRQAEKAATQAAKNEPQAERNLAEAARRQAEVAERLSKLDVPKQLARHEQAQQALNKALAELLDQRPNEIGPSQQQARQALEKLEQAVAGKKVAEEVKQPAGKASDESPRQLAKQLAEQQKQLANATQQAAQKPGPAGKEALEQVARQQQQLNQQAGQLSANQNQRVLAQARQAMNQAQQALAKNDANQAQQRQREAANALENLARQLPEQTPTPTPKAGPPPKGLPNADQVAAARKLAQEQRDLQKATQQMMAQAAKAPPQNPVGELAQQQQEIAQQAAALARAVGEKQGPQAPATQQAGKAAQAAQQAAQKMQAGALPQAQKLGEQSAQELKQLASQLQQTPTAREGQAQQAAQLAQKQEELNRKLKPLAGEAPAQLAQQQAQQLKLQQQAGKLMQDLGKLAQETAAPAKQAAQQAASSSQQAQAAMKQAAAQSKLGNQGQSEQAGLQAAKMLDQAAQQAAQAAQQMAGKDGMANQQTGKALQEGKQQMGQAQGKLAQGQPQGAQAAMRQAAQALQQAASKADQQMASAKKPGQPAPNGQPSQELSGNGMGLPDLAQFGEEAKQFAGRPWGELPGELRTRILQDMRTRYGDEYAEFLQRYFARLSDTNRKK
jgi:hypothetical protein